MTPDLYVYSFIKKIIPDRVYHKEDFENGDICKVIFEIVDAKST